MQLHDPLEKYLQQYFGFDHFRSNQKQIVQSLVNGHDVLTLMSTGGGKSLCFQLPAVLLDGLTVVISPLISLMEDQVAHLRKQKIDATWITHLLPEDETAYRLDLVTINHYKLLYVSPERLQDKHFCALLQLNPISLVVVDEAHCISEWGHEFRPEYRQITQFLARFKTRPIVAAFTATATLEVAKDIVEQLALEQPSIFHTSVTRTNLALHVIHCFKQHEKWLHVVRILQHHHGENGIVYAATRENAAMLAQHLQQLAKDVPACSWLSVGYYHAGLNDAERRTAQDHFQKGKYNVLCATTAFGMGIDKGDIRFVIHTEHPNCIESYYQQVGRAGRDGLPSAAYLLFHPLDYMIHWQMIQQQKLPSSRQRSHIRLQAMIDFCQGKTVCRMSSVTRYFGETTNKCAQCDICRGTDSRHPYFQTPLSSKELGIIPQLIDLAKNSRAAIKLTDFQLLCSACMRPETLDQWSFVPGCGKGWRIEYEQRCPQ